MVGFASGLGESRDLSQHVAAVGRAVGRQREEVLEGRIVDVTVGLARGGVWPGIMGR